MAISKIESNSITSNAITSEKISSNTIDTSDLSTSLQGALGVRNLIINGDMRIAQRGTSVSGITSSSGNYYTVDRMGAWMTSAGTWTMTQDNDVPEGFYNSIKWSCTTANASLSAGSYLHLTHNIEAQNCQVLKFGSSSAESLTLSFWVKSNKTGTYVVEFYHDDASKSLSKTYTIDTADTWEKKTVTVAGNTANAIVSDNGMGLQIWHWLIAGTNFSSGTAHSSWATRVIANDAPDQTVNLADSTSNYINITGVQLEVGDTATPFEHRPYDMELARCQRYYYKWNTTTSNNWICWAMAANTTNMYGHVPFPVTMRSNASSIDYSGLGWWLGGAVTAFSAVGIAESGTTSCTMNFTSTGLTAQKMYAVLPNGGSNYIAFNAEL